jgi:hypothetical protein
VSVVARVGLKNLNDFIFCSLIDLVFLVSAFFGSSLLPPSPRLRRAKENSVLAFTGYRTESSARLREDVGIWMSVAAAVSAALQKMQAARLPLQKLLRGKRVYDFFEARIAAQPISYRVEAVPTG